MEQPPLKHEPFFRWGRFTLHTPWPAFIFLIGLSVAAYILIRHAGN